MSAHTPGPADTAMADAASWWSPVLNPDLGPDMRMAFRAGWDRRNEMTKELMEALEDLAEKMRLDGWDDSSLASARAVLAKARGGA